jgi:uncharacterized protein DUF4375
VTDILDKNNFLIYLSESVRTDFGKVDFEKQSVEQRVFSAIWRLESEVNNGGFEQYFQNDRGETVSFAPEALKRVGANQCAGIVDRAIRTLCGPSLPVNEGEWQTVVAGMSDGTRQNLNGLDREFYKYPDDLTELLFEFVSKYPKVFGPVGT